MSAGHDLKEMRADPSLAYYERRFSHCGRVMLSVQRLLRRRWREALVKRVASPDRLDAEAEALVASIVAKPRAAIAIGRPLFYRQLETGIEAAYEDAARTMACNMMDASPLEGVQAFIEKRPPGWAPPAPG